MIDPVRWKAMSRQERASSIVDVIDNAQWSNDALFEDFVLQYQNLMRNQGYDLEKDPLFVVFSIYLSKCKTLGEFRTKIRQDLLQQAAKEGENT